jgi:hypothetical protein
MGFYSGKAKQYSTLSSILELSLICIVIGKFCNDEGFHYFKISQK